ncbi:IPT/TIG domain-containing protein [Algoriphagus sp. AK58]|uniref:IPT/TIG domain-containing protein n=1 Tax=Algoriphagus sp. AK58 TaxID=1406877 RepID=UPI001650B279|nr:IPT/TIG domain-containing protein [Algoriphagus sp. AK58]
MRKLLSVFIFYLLLVFCACTEENETPILVATEDLLFVGGDKIRISGRLLTNREVLATDHGFLFSTESSFSSPITLSLGEKKNPGRFIGESKGFKVGQTYFAKAYAEVQGQRIEGDVVQLQTLIPAVETFFPTYALQGAELTIQGRNFPEGGTRVFFGNQEAQIIQNLFESRLIVRVPAPAGQIIVPLRIVIQDKEIILSTRFEYQSGKFTKIAEFPESIRIYDNLSFYNSAGFHVGLGRIRLGNPYPGFQRFEPTSRTWTKIDFPGEPRRFGFATSNFLGGGGTEIDREIYSPDLSFWKINGSDFERLPDLPFQSIEPLAVEWNSNLFLFGGRAGDSFKVRIFNPATQVWSERKPAPFAIEGNSAISVFENKIIFLSNTGDVWEYLPTLDSWNLKTSYPGNKGQLGFPMIQILGKKAYMGLFRRTQEIWELDLETGVWKAKNPIIGFPQSINAGSFQLDGAIYILRTAEESVFGNLPMELYKFDPDAI